MLFGLGSRLLVRLGDMDVARQKSSGLRSLVSVRLPQLAPIREFLGDDRVRVDVLGDVEVHPGRILEARRAVGGEPDGRPRLLVRLWRGVRVDELEELAFEVHALIAPGLEDHFEDLLADLTPSIEGHVPAYEFVGRDAGPGAEIQPAPGELVEHGRVLGKAQRLVEGKLIDHHAEPDDARGAGQRRQVDVWSAQVAEGGCLVLYGEVVLVAYLLRLLGYSNVRVEHVRRRGRLRHDGLAEYVVKADLQLVHIPCLRRTL